MAKKKQPTIKKPKGIPCPVYPTWTEAKFWGFIRSALRSGSNRWPVKYQVLKDARREYRGPNKRQKWELQCNECKGWFKSADCSVDHIVPAGKLNSYEDVAGFIERLFVGPEGLQVLCRGCHSEKTRLERSGK